MSHAMATLALITSLAALLGSSSAQSTESGETVWSSVAFILTGESTPLQSPYSGSGATLTTLGAQQMNHVGSIFRARYLTPNVNITRAQNRITNKAPIDDIETMAIDNSQLYIAAPSDMQSSASAQAFMQGLYPPSGQTSADTSSAVLANGSLLDFPLGGYQYPNIQTLSSLDPMSVWIQGHASCAEYQATKYTFLRSTTAIQESYNTSLSFYHDLWPRIFAGAFTLGMTNFFYADDLYDYAQYVWNHNKDSRDIMTENELDLLRTFASLQQWQQNGDLTYSGLVEGDMIRAIAGRTLAGRVLSLFSEFLSYSGNARKLNLMFGSREPFVSFFALAGLDEGVSKAVFRTLPNPGAAMVFELFSLGSANNSQLPAHYDLMVRFLYRNSTDEEASFTEYPLFSHGPSTSRMLLAEFENGMDKFNLHNITSWCKTCGSNNSFCAALTSNSSPYAGSSKSASRNMLAPAAAGAIGAVVTLGVIGLAFLATVCFVGLRFQQREPKKRLSSGFKGPEKKDGDPDVVFSANGAQHERTGSWELRGGGAGESNVAKPAAIAGKTEAVITTRDFTRSDKYNDDDLMHVTPVSPREDV